MIGGAPLLMGASSGPLTPYQAAWDYCVSWYKGVGSKVAEERGNFSWSTNNDINDFIQLSSMQTHGYETSLWTETGSSILYGWQRGGTFDLGSGDFGFGGWFRIDGISGGRGSNEIIGSGGHILVIRALSDDGYSIGGRLDGYTTFTVAESSTGLPANQWSHIWCGRNGPIVTAYINGIVVGTCSIGASPLFGDWSEHWHILGGQPQDQHHCAARGYATDVLVFKGKDPFGGVNFTPPGPVG